MRLLVDTNVWSYLVNAGAVEEVSKAARTSPHQVLACPAVVYEILRLKDRPARDRMVRAVCRSRWTRMMPEAYCESEELRAEIRLFHPEWLRTDPDLRSWHQQRADWAGQRGFWWRARTQTDQTAGFIEDLDMGHLDRARREATEAGRQMKNTVTFDKVTLDKWTTTALLPVPGWNGEPVETWRVATWQHYDRQLLRRRVAPTTEQEWLEPWLDLDRIRAEPRRWTRFFIEEADKTRLPRNWLRWAANTLAWTRTISKGTPVDNQIASYLVDADGLVTADKVFVAVCARLHSEAPFPVARPFPIPSAELASARLLELLTTTD